MNDLIVCTNVLEEQSRSVLPLVEISAADGSIELHWKSKALFTAS